MAQIVEISSTISLKSSLFKCYDVLPKALFIFFYILGQFLVSVFPLIEDGVLFHIKLWKCFILFHI